MNKKEKKEARMTKEEFKVIRLKLGLSQVDLAKIMKVNPQRVWEWENTRSPTKIHAAFLSYIESHPPLK